MNLKVCVSVVYPLLSFCFSVRRCIGSAELTSPEQLACVVSSFVLSSGQYYYDFKRGI